MRRYLGPLIWAATALIAIEIALETRANSRGFRTLLFGTPGSSMPITDESNETPTRQFGPNDSFPFRSPVIQPKRKEGICRIWIASASHAQDQRYGADQVFPFQLEDELKDRGFECEVLNASRAGLGLAENASDITTLGPIWKPDLVVIYQMSTSLVADVRRQNTGQESLSGISLQQLWFSKIQALGELTTTYEVLKSNVSARIQRSAILTTTLSSTAEDDFLASIDNVRRASHDIGAQVAVCTFAIRKPDGMFTDDDQFILLKTAPGFAPSAWADVVNDWNEKLRREYPESELIELAHPLRTTPEYFRDPVHFTPEGHVVVAKLLADRIIELEFSQNAKGDSGK